MEYINLSELLFYYKHCVEKKEGCHPDNQSFINLKSNTMKNTMQRYGLFLICNR